MKKGNKVALLLTLTLTLTLCFTLCACGGGGGTCNVTYDAGGGEIRTIVYNSGDQLLDPGMELYGYTVEGWYDAHGKKWKIGKDKIATDLYLTAHWVKRKFAVTFDFNGGALVGMAPATEAEYGSKLTEPSAIMTGHTVMGWYAGGKVWDFGTDVVKSELTLSAIWSVDSVQVTINPDNGEAIRIKEIGYGGSVSRPFEPAKEGYSFIGWYVGEKEYNFGTPVTQALEITAQWGKLRFEVIVDGITEKVNYGEKATKPEELPSKEGHTFVGWFTDKGAAFDFDEKIFANVTVAARYRVNEYKVTVDDGVVTQTQTVEYGAKAEAPVSPTREGYVFGGWIAFGKPFDFASATITGDTAVTAKWDKIKYSVTIKLFGADDRVLSVDYGLILTLPDPPKRDGYEFLGFYGSDGVLYEGAPVYGDLVLTGQWRKLLINVEYIFPEGTIQSFGEQKNNGEKVIYRPVVDSYNFKGYYTDSGYTDPYEISDPLIEDVTLYGKFEKAQSCADFTYAYQAGDTWFVKVKSGVELSETVVMPESYAGLMISGIADGTSGAPAFLKNLTVIKVVLPDSYTYIGNYAFYNCVSLTEINYNAVEEIGDYAFAGSNAGAGAMKLTAFTFKDSVKKVGASAFRYNIGLTSLNFAPEGRLSSIGASAFQYTALTSLSFPKSLKSIGDKAFQYTWTINSLIFNDGLEEIGASAFASVVTASGKNVFGFTELSFPASLLSIGNSAFEYCLNVTAINFPADGRLQSIGNYAFRGGMTATYDGLVQYGPIFIPASVKTIGTSAFTCSKNLTSVTFGKGSVLESIGSSCFAGVYVSADKYLLVPLGKANIPASVRTIGDYAFNLTKLTEVDFGQNSSLLSLGNGVFSTWGGTGTAQSPAETDEELSNFLQTVTLPASLQSIGVRAFGNCRDLKTVTFTGDALISIGNSAFQYCDDLSKVILPESLTSLGNSAFLNCSKLAEVRIASKELPVLAGVRTFDGCAGSLKIYIDGSQICRAGKTKYWSDYAKKLYVTAGTEVPVYSVSFNINGVIDSSEQYVGGETVDLPDTPVLAGQVFLGWYLDKAGAKIYDPSSPVNADLSIYAVFAHPETLDAEYTFELNADNRSYSLVSVIGEVGENAVLPSEYHGKPVTRLGDFSSTSASGFCNSGTLKTVTIPDSYEYIGDYAFYNCLGLTSITFGNGIKELGQYAFASNIKAELNRSLTSVSFPDSLEVIGAYAFYCNLGLKTIGFAPNGRLREIAGSAFSGSASRITRREGSGRNQKTYYAFDSMNFESVTLPASLEKIGSSAFAYNKGLKLVSFEPGGHLRDIESSAFSNKTTYTMDTGEICDSVLQAVINIPGTLAGLDNNAFAQCAALTTVVFMQNDVLEKIGNSAFLSCGSLYSINLNSLTNLRSVGSSAFNGCAALTLKSLPAAVELIDSGAFGGTAISAFTLTNSTLAVNSASAFPYENDGFELRMTYAQFDGYYRTAQYFDDEYADSVVLTDVRESGIFRVLFYSGETLVSTDFYAVGQRVLLPQNPTLSDKIFAGWYLDENCTVKADFSSLTVGEADTRLYAKWL